MEKVTAGLIGADFSSIRIDFTGLNHLVFGLNVYNG
jgi:alpha-galactosidase/6-phospho-beta-glucosidase family protein